MNPFIVKILIDVARKKLEKKQDNTPVTKREIVPLARNYEVEISHAVKEYIYIILFISNSIFRGRDVPPPKTP